jgi:hypothetical protein
MARKKYTVTIEDTYSVSSWVTNKLEGFSFPSEDYDVRQSAKKDFELIEWHSYKASKEEKLERANKFNAWCEKYLNKKQWTALKTTIRKNRIKHNNKRTITLDGQAHQILSHISKMQNITLSEVIEQHLQSVQFELMDKESEKRYQENKKKRERDERTVDMFAKE